MRKSEQRRITALTTDRHLTPAALTKLQREYDDLVEHRRPAAAAEVQRAAAMGDLSENFGYQEAKGELRRINNRILLLEDIINNAVIIKSGVSADGKIKIGSTVVLRNNNRDNIWQIVGTQESRPEEGRISYLSPLGTVLVDKEAGQEIEFRGQKYKIVSVN